MKYRYLDTESGYSIDNESLMKLYKKLFLTSYLKQC